MTMEEQSDEDFIEWLRETLIPDLHESGQENLVADFERLIQIITTEERWLVIKEAGMVSE
jgi:hypothetical protein